MKDLLRVLHILPRREIYKCVGIFVAMLIGGLLESVGISAIMPLISVMVDENFLHEHKTIATLAEQFGLHTQTEVAVAGACILMLIFVLKNMYIAWELHLQINFALRNQVVYSNGMLKQYLLKPYMYFLGINTATLLKNIERGAQTVFSNMVIPIFLLFTELSTAVIIGLMLILVEPFTAIFMAVFMVSLVFFILRMFRGKIYIRGESLNSASAQYFKWMNQALNSIKETKVMEKEHFFLHEFMQSYKKFAVSMAEYRFLCGVPQLIIEVMVVCALMALIIVKIQFMGQGPQQIIPVLALLALSAVRLMPCANRIIGPFQSLKFQIPLFNEIYSELEAIKKSIEARDEDFTAYEEQKLNFTKEIIVRDVSFNYPESNKCVLEKINFSIPKGSFAGIIGSSGAGKTTFVDVLLGLLKPTCGEICVDGVDIQSNLSGWRANIAYVPQDIYLLDGTVRENIAFGVSVDKIDDNMVDKALKMAELYEFVSGLTDGVNTPVGERGIKLSGGQKQRIGIARALYRQPDVLVLDEATSALDGSTEKSITDTILKLKGKLTIISIAHRLSTLENCDFKIRFQEGKAEIVH